MFYYSYYGNKRTEYKYIKNLVENTNFKLFVEPFCGTCSTSYNVFLFNKDIKFHINDSDKMHIRFLEDIKLNGHAKYFNLVREMDISPEFHKHMIENYKKYPNNLLFYFYYNKVYDIRKGLYPARGIKFKEMKSYIIYDSLFKISKITDLDYMEILEIYRDNKDALLYLDPPYFDSCNVTYSQYNKNNNTNYVTDNTGIYINIINFMRSCKCYFIMIINDNAIMRYIFKDFIVMDYNKMYSQTKKKTKHIIISNIINKYNSTPPNTPT